MMSCKKTSNGIAVHFSTADCEGYVTFDQDGSVMGHRCVIHQKKIATQKMPCVHRGEQNGEAECGSCGGNVRIKLFQCTVHGWCHLSPKPIEGVKMCQGCVKFQPSAGRENM